MTLTTYELAAMFRRACVSRFTAMKVCKEQLNGEAFDELPEKAEKCLLSDEFMENLADVRKALDAIQAGKWKGTDYISGWCGAKGGAPRRTSGETVVE